MGEPPTPINTAIDANDRLRRMYYVDAPEGHKEIRLGHAVAASSCVPGLFEPLILDGLFPCQSVRLIDGGVCDNQGGSSLLEQDCTVMIVSDASGQMDSQPAPAASMIGVPLRANAILQARVREAQYADAAARQRSLLLRGLMFLHLKQDLPARSLPWTNIPSSRAVSDFEDSRSASIDETPYGIATATQRRLAAIRTDLDSFSDVEAFALMASGYQMTKRQLHIGTAHQFPVFAPDLPVSKQRKDLYAGLGLIVFDGPKGHGFFKGGHDGQTANTMVCVEKTQRCVLILANDVLPELLPELSIEVIGTASDGFRMKAQITGHITPKIAGGNTGRGAVRPGSGRLEQPGLRLVQRALQQFQGVPREEASRVALPGNLHAQTRKILGSPVQFQAALREHAGQSLQHDRLRFGRSERRQRILGDVAEQFTLAGGVGLTDQDERSALS
jgi:hypothetical protein